MAWVIVQRVAFVDAAFLLAVVVGVVGIGFDVGANLPVGVELDAVDIGFANVKVFTHRVGVVAIDRALVGRRGFTNGLFRNLVFELRIEHGAIERQHIARPVQTQLRVNAFLRF